MLYVLTRLLLAPLVRVVYRPVVRGRDNIPRTGPVIFASNHLSFVDSVVIALLSPRPVHFLAKDAYFTGTGVKGLVLRGFFSAFGCVPVNRGGHRSAQASLEVAEGVLAHGRGFGIYPEGTRSPDGRLYRGRTGVAWLALKTGAPVVPVALTGTDQLQPIGRYLPRLRRVTLEFGKPMHFTATRLDERPAPARRAVTDTIMHAIGDLSGQDHADGYAAVAGKRH
nr:lysophospholipid acyltransferase family protein [Kibdelosporangium sp. MJ126-NF4]CEL13834.1 1-acyl-sn-glycerol-3-phosphate acyltransferase [Kibdelosporangium sp. MJ126-NF4]CTQ88202.1 1-acyl-sn-glycerol-3-phosphate acyltransferase (EC 2.3.1.51) [Kibdelosporangium sp. MJ126-NF4]